jgi:hypothetical protein
VDNEKYEFPDAGAPLTAKDQALAIPTSARAIAVRNQVDLNAANEMLKVIKRLHGEISATFDPHIKKAVEQHKGLLAEKRRFTDPLDAAEATIKPKIASYLYDEDQKRLAEARARYLAEKAAEEEASKAVDKANELIKQGKVEEAAQVVETGYAKVEALKASAPDEKPAAKADGTSLRTTWDFEITDEALIPRDYLTPDLGAIRKHGQARKDQARIPGVRFFASRSVSTRING